MKRLSWLIPLIAAAALSQPALAQSVTVIVNGQTMNFSQPPIERAGRVFVPLRGIFEQLGATVVYSNGQINATGRGRTVSLTIGSTQAVVAGQPTTLDVAPFIVGATTFVPLRFISQSLGATVDWNNATSTVTIGGAGPPPQPYPPPRPQREVSLVSKWPTGTIYSSNPTLRFQVDRQVRMSSIQVWLDGSRINQELQQTGPMTFAIYVARQVYSGSHRVRVTGTTPNGTPFEFTWTFYRA